MTPAKIYILLIFFSRFIFSTVK